MIKPMLAHVYSPKRFSTPAFVQPKLDGIRALYSAGQFYSRDGIQWAPNVLRHLTEALSHVAPKIVLDGELYVHRWPLQRINSAVAVKRVAPNAETHLVQYHVFDLVSNQPFIQRWSNADDVVGYGDMTTIQMVETRPCASPEALENWFVTHRACDYEGTMLRLGSQGYTQPHVNADQDNRTWTMLKRKGWLDGWFECIEAVEGEGKHSGKMGALVLYTGTKCFEVGTGFSDVERERLWRDFTNGYLPSRVKIQYRYLSADGIPCHTSFIETDD